MWVLSVGRLGFFLSVIMISTTTTSLMVNAILYAANIQLAHQLSDSQTQMQDLEQRLLEPIGFQTIRKGYYSGHKNPAYYVIENESQWTNVWNQYQSTFWPKRPPPKINFSRITVIAVFMGEHSVGGHRIEIKEIFDSDGFVVVKVEKSYPGRRCGVTEAFSQPYHIVKMNKINKDVTFETIVKTRECP